MDRTAELYSLACTHNPELDFSPSVVRTPTTFILGALQLHANISRVDGDDPTTDIVALARVLGEALKVLEASVSYAKDDLHGFYSGIVVSLYMGVEDVSRRVAAAKRGRVESKRLISEIARPKEFMRPVIVPDEVIGQPQYQHLGYMERKLFEKEGLELLNRDDEELEEARRTAEQMSEISEMIGVFSTKIMEQEEQIDGILGDHERALGHMEKGAEQLLSTLDRESTNNHVMLVFILTSAFSLLFLHWFNN